MRIARSALAAPCAALVLVSSCLSDRPVNGLGGNAAVALRVLAPAAPTATGAAISTAPKQFAEIIIGIGCYNCTGTGKQLAPGVLFDQYFDLGPGFQRVAATFPFAPCAGYYPPDNVGPYCDVQITILLHSDSVVVGSQYLYGVRIRPGVVTQADSVFFGAFTTGSPVRGVKVEAGLVWYGMDASSAFGGVTAAIATIIDSTGCYCNTTTQYFGKPYAVVAQGIPAQYAVVPGRTAAQYQAQVEDAHGSVSYPPETQGIDPPNGNVAPFVYALSSDTTATDLAVSATGFSVLATTDHIDFVVRSVPNKLAQDTIYMVCSIHAPGQFNTASGSCPRVGPHFTAAVVVAVPVDATAGAGFGASCGLGLVCNYGTVSPQRRR